MKGTMKKIEENIYELDTGRYRVEMNFLNPTTNKYIKKRKVLNTLGEAKEFREDFKAKIRLNMLPQKLLRVITLGEMIEIVKEKKAEHQTFDDIERHLGDIESFFTAEKPLEKITTMSIKWFTTWLKQRPKKRQHKGFLSNQSIDHVLKELRFLLREAKKRDMIEKVPEIPFVRNYGHREFNLDKDGFIKVVNHLPKPPFPHRAMLLVALNTGQRRGDLSNMTWDQIKDDHLVYRSSKTQKEGIQAPLMSVTRDALEILRKGSVSPFIFVNPRTGKPLKDMRKALTTACQKAGVERFTMHHLRHLATTVLLEHTTGDRDLVKRIIGWSSMDMIDRYGHIGHRAIPAFDKLNHQLTEGLRQAL